MTVPGKADSGSSDPSSEHLTSTSDMVTCLKIGGASPPCIEQNGAVSLKLLITPAIQHEYESGHSLQRLFNFCESSRVPAGPDTLDRNFDLKSTWTGHINTPEPPLPILQRYRRVRFFIEQHYSHGFYSSLASKCAYKISESELKSAFPLPDLRTH